MDALSDAVDEGAPERPFRANRCLVLSEKLSLNCRDLILRSSNV